MKLKEITIEVTQQCPNCCVHCSSLSSLRKTTCLSTEKIIEVINDAVVLGCQIINISGGEPFLHPRLKQIIDHVFKKGLKCYIYTSGISLVDGKPRVVSKDILESLKGKVNKYIVNVEAVDEDTYNQVMGTAFGGFEMMKQFVKNAVGLGDIVEAHFVPMKLNYQQIPDVVKMCAELGVSRVSFLRFVPQGRGFENRQDILLDKEGMSEVKLMMDECVKKNASNIRIGIPFSSCNNRTNCLTGIDKLVVRYDGNVYPCEAFKNEFYCDQVQSLPDNVNQTRLEFIYSSSDFLCEIRNLNATFQKLNTCESCVNQYYRNLNSSKNDKID